MTAVALEALQAGLAVEIAVAVALASRALLGAGATGPAHGVEPRGVVAVVLTPLK